jgi:predicted flap endonuclease-1-like 5' DNA nuclease
MSVEVTFLLPNYIVRNATGGLLLGDFNNWNAELGFPLTRTEDGSLTVTISLQPGQTYQYRYLLDDGRWENDDNARYYSAAEGLHVENCVVTAPEKEEKTPVAKAKKAAPKKAATKKTAKPKAAAAQKDDLVKIEGIGKQIASLLNKNGILSYSQLSKSSAKKLKEILEAAGPKFNIHQPGSWPKQAKLAAAAKWEELEALQKELKGGK